MALVRLTYLKVYRDRHGTVRRYFRRRGQKDIRLKGEPGTAEFMQAYQAAFDRTTLPVDGTRAGTFARLITDYCRSAAFANLKPSSQKLYKLVLDRIADRHGHRLVRDARRSDARKMIEEIGAAKPAMANITRAVLRLLMQHAVETELRLDNPVSNSRAIVLAPVILGRTMSCHNSSSDGSLERANGSRLRCCSIPVSVQATLSKCGGPISTTE